MVCLTGEVSFGRDEASRRIEAAARDGLQRLAEAKVPDWPGPYRFALMFQDEAQARNAALVPGAEIVSNSSTVQVRANDFEGGYRLSLRLIGLAGLVGRNDARASVIGAQPNAAQLRGAVTDWLYDRFLNRLPPPATGIAGASGERPRYWGARS